MTIRLAPGAAGIAMAVRVVPRAGHNLPQEEPEAFAAAVMEVIKA